MYFTVLDIDFLNFCASYFCTRSGVVDASGLRMMVTSQLREFDAGVLTLGHNVSPTQVVPPGVTWTTSGQCSGECTKKVGRVGKRLIKTDILKG